MWYTKLSFAKKFVRQLKDVLLLSTIANQPRNKDIRIQTEQALLAYRKEKKEGTLTSHDKMKKKLGW